MRANQCGFFLYYNGIAVARADDPFELFRYVLTTMMVKGGSVT